MSCDMTAVALFACPGASAAAVYVQFAASEGCKLETPSIMTAIGGAVRAFQPQQ
jgi:hypothetical protein